MLGRLGRMLVAAMITASLVRGYAFAATQMPFPRPPAIESNVQFWVDVFSGYGERDFVIHDRDQVWRIYQVMHLPGGGTPGRGDADAIGDYLKVKYANILSRLAAGQPPANYEERRVADLFKGEPLSAYALAAQNLRVQQGMRERFQEGLLRSRYYRPTMERIFRTAGLPPELVTLAEIESGFYSRAKSGAGAVGIWQFTRGTGREYMRITRYHDDRLNPTTETEAAAQLLRSNYATLGNWPLAITAYNYGTGGMANAASQYHSDYERIVRSYSGSRFGFASKNYYPEFLAALQIHQYEDQYFPNLKYQDAPAPPAVKTDFAPSGRGARHPASAHHAARRSRHTHRQHRSVARRSRATRHMARSRDRDQHLAEAAGATPS
jgi:membrane-bound lytic murein transglycosylase D